MVTAAPDVPRAPARPLAVALTSIAFLMVTLDALVVVTAMPAIHASLGGGSGPLQWIINAYNLVFAAGILTGAALGDRFGRRRLFLAGLALFTTASAGCALSPTLDLLIACRAAQGAGAAVLAPVGLALVTDAFGPARRGAAVGLWGGISGIGVAAGPLVGGAVTQGLDWHWVFWVNVPIGLLALAGCGRALSETHGARRPLDLPGMTLVAVSLAALVAGLIEVPTGGWGATRTLVGLAVFALALLGFLAREARAAHPMIPLGLFRGRTFSAANAANLLGSAAIFSAAVVMSEFFQLGRGDGPLATGLRFLPWTVTPLFVAPLAGAWSDRIGARALAAPGLAMQALGFAAVVVLAGSHAPWIAYVPAFLFAGVGISLALPSLPAAAIGAVEVDQLGVASGVVSTMQRVGAVLGVAIITAVFGAHGSLGSPGAVVVGSRWALGAAAILSLLGAGVALLIVPRRAATIQAGPAAETAMARPAVETVLARPAAETVLARPADAVAYAGSQRQPSSSLHTIRPAAEAAEPAEARPADAVAYAGSQRQPSSSLHTIGSPSPATPDMPWSASEQYSPGS